VQPSSLSQSATVWLLIPQRAARVFASLQRLAQSVPLAAVLEVAFVLDAAGVLFDAPHAAKSPNEKRAAHQADFRITES
jgi:hypothetical protein